MTQTLLAFTVAGIRLGLEAAHVVEVLPSLRLVTPPEMPPLLRGFITVTGRLIPVIRLEKILHGPQYENQGMGLEDRLVVARLGRLEVAWVAGADMEPLSFRTRDCVALPPDHVLNNCASHIVPGGAEPVVVLATEKLLLEEERLRLDQLRQMAADRISLLKVQPSLPTAC